ncbi:ERF family protein [Hydrogenophaga sp. 2FB]|uniref:ERF family protein n=1 Tax=Hydrogenophaga sp. 2FB TaxID=2502187 RepID=UPI0010F9DD04|nr:ERF family protein [Hydrogenophaga sp. 2FB]
MNDVIEMKEPTSAASLQQVATPALLLQMAVQQGADMDKLKQLMDLQERWEANEARKAFREDFAGFRGENIIIPKTKHVDRGRGGSFDQAEYDQVTGRLSPALSRHGFGFRHDQKFGLKRMMIDGVENDVGWVWVTCHLEHRKGHTESLELEGPPGDLSVNTPTQNMQTTASYLKRQSLLAITGTATGGEDDESKMRKSRGSEQQGEGELEAMVEFGRDAAMGGMKALTAWWGGLTAKQRSSLNKDFPSMRAAAQAADRGGNHA